jgi:hypothetical protein
LHDQSFAHHNSLVWLSGVVLVCVCLVFLVHAGIERGLFDKQKRVSADSQPSAVRSADQPPIPTPMAPRYNGLVPPPPSIYIQS